MAKKKILLLSDDLRMTSGIATISRQLVVGTVDKYDWVQLGAAIKHPDEGKVFDLSEDIKNRTGVQDASVKLYASSGYGNADTLRQVLNAEQPDAILHFTDPRYWIWLYDIEHEIRQHTPIFFYHIWDDLPDPKYNRNYYESCDWIGTISKQTYGITKRVWGNKEQPQWKQPADWQVSYVPHGIRSDIYKPTEVTEEFKKSIFGANQYDFVVYWTNRNIRRKQPIEAILAFNEFVKKLTPEQRKKAVLLMHTQPVDDNGTDLPAVVRDCCIEDCNVLFDDRKRPDEELNLLYNLADVTLTLSSNEGFGLGTAESIMAGTPIITTVTGGLQDQCGFEVDGKYLTADDYIKIGSLHDKKKYDKVKHGEWVKPIWPVRSATGSVPTPYIFDDRIDYEDVEPLITEWYNTPKKERKAAGLKGREWMLGEGGLSAENMCKTLSDGMEVAFKNWKPKKQYELFKVK